MVSSSLTLPVVHNEGVLDWKIGISSVCCWFYRQLCRFICLIALFVLFSVVYFQFTFTLSTFLHLDCFRLLLSSSFRILSLYEHPLLPWLPALFYNWLAEPFVRCSLVFVAVNVAKLFLRVHTCEHCSHCALHLPFWVNSAAQSICAVVLETVDFKSYSGFCLLPVACVLYSNRCLLPVIGLYSAFNLFLTYHIL